MEHLHELVRNLRGTGLALGAALVVGGIAISVVAAVAVAVSWPPDQFKRPESRRFRDGRHPAVLLSRVAKNLLGWSLILVGLVLSLPGVPGQGILTMIIGLTLIDFPGKARLERYLVGRPSVLRAVNAVRHRFGKPPLEMV